MIANLGPIAVTDPTGFVGSRLTSLLGELRVPLVAILEPGRDRPRVDADVRAGNVDTGAGVAQALTGVRTFIHLGSLRQALWLAPAVEQAGVTRAIFVGTTGTHTRLPSTRADRQRAGEDAVRATKLDWTILRSTLVYGGPGDRTMERLIRWVRRSPVTFVPGSGATLQQPVHVDDLVDAILAALERPSTAGRAYDLGGAEAVPLRAMIATCARLLGAPALLVPAPTDGVHRLIRVASQLGVRVPLTPELVHRLAEGRAVDIGLAMRDLGFMPRGIEAGLRSEIELLFPPRARARRAA